MSSPAHASRFLCSPLCVDRPPLIHCQALSCYAVGRKRPSAKQPSAQPTGKTTVAACSSCQPPHCKFRPVSDLNTPATQPPASSATNPGLRGGRSYRRVPSPRRRWRCPRRRGRPPIGRYRCVHLPVNLIEQRQQQHNRRRGGHPEGPPDKPPGRRHHRCHTGGRRRRCYDHVTLREGLLDVAQPLHEGV